MRRVLVVGGGIGGLTAAVALQQRGLEAHVYEAAPELREVGAGIWVPTNAMQVLARLGLAAQVAAEGMPMRRAEVHDARAGRLHVLDMEGLARSFGHPTIAIHRGRLQALLARSLAPGTLHLGRRLERLAQDDSGVRVHFADGSEAAGDVLVGADGLRSAVREALFPGHPLRDSGQSSYRALVSASLPPELDGASWEVWGPHCRFGLSAVGPGQVYWYATFDAPPGGRDAPGEGRRRVDALAAHFPAPIPALAAATPEAALTRTDLSDLRPLPRWHRGRVVLLGDAAHATTPNLGQGGAQAMEDAWALGRELAAPGRALEDALARYTAARRPKAAWVVQTSWRMGRIVHVANPVGRALRNAAVRLTPAGVQRRQFERLYAVDD